MFSFAGETVFDPFLGSGTTSLAAKNLDRNSIGYEINKEYAAIIKEKMGSDQLSILGTQVIFTEDKKSDNYSFNDLPYIFHDPHKMDKQIDVKKLTFGSKIDKDTKKREELFTVNQILSPEEIVLNNGIKVKLIGVKSNEETIDEAIEFLQEKFNKRKVFLKFDTIKYDKNKNLLCYLYLDNKTFINNHLIRTGYVDVDTSYDYSCKDKFFKSSPK